MAIESQEPENPAERSAATVADLPSSIRSSSAAASASLVAGSQHATILTGADFVEVLRSSEVERTRRFAPIMMLMGIGIGIILTFLGGHPTAKRICYGAIVVGLLALTILYRLAGRPERFTEARVGAVYAVCILCLYAAVYYFGAFSAANSICILGLFFTGIGRSRRVATMLYVVTVLAQATLATAIIAGWVVDRGLVTAGDMSIDQQIAVQLAIQVVFLVTFLVAGATRSQLSSAVRDHEDAVRQVSKRDALLEEARLELDRAKRIGGPGRYTGQLFGSYVLGAVIGRGAMGEVYEASHRETGDAAAVKLLQINALGRPELLARFRREAEIVARLDSPHVVKLLEVGDNDSVLPYLAMERLVGIDLGARLRRGEAFTSEMILDLVRDIAAGLEAARKADIIHRDIKPQNLFLASTEDGAVWKILDFGVSKLLATSADGTLTHGQVVGTPAYMAPEQAQGLELDHRADLYALGAVVYRAFTLQPPFPGKDVASVLRDVVTKMPPRPGEVAALSKDIDRVLAIALAKNPSDRFETPTKLTKALELALEGRLSHTLRVRADELISTYPWGTDVDEVAPARRPSGEA